MNIAAAVCFAGAALIILAGHDIGWGWLIFAGIIVAAN